MSEIKTTIECGANDQFTPEFKRLKARNPPPDLSGVIDLTTLNLSQHGVSSHVEKGILQYPVKSCDLRPITGVRPWKEWKCIQFTDYPGLIVIQNPFIDGYQRYWIYRCLQDFPSDRENVTNLSSLGDDGSRELWDEFAHKRSSAFDKHDPLRKLRWTTLGYHYNWTTKEYSEDQKAPFPADVNFLSQYIGACLGFAPYRAEAAIVNYYHLDSTLAGHTDHSELDHSAPLFSISFGQTAIFLLGGHTKSVRPMSVFLRSGDICVMSGECRLAYHAVPKILAPSPDKPVPSCFNLTQVFNHAAHDVTTSRHNSSGFCEHSAEVKTCEPKSSCEHNSVIFHNSNDTSSASTGLCDTCILLEHQDSQKYHHNITIAEVMVKSEPALLNCDNLTVKEYEPYISSYNSNIDQVNSGIEHVVGTLDFAPFEVYLKSSRINLNIRQVLPPGCDQLDDRLQSDRGDNSSDCCMGDNLQADNVKVLDNSKVSMEFDAEKICVLPKHDGSEIKSPDVTVVKKIRTDL